MVVLFSALFPWKSSLTAHLPLYLHVTVLLNPPANVTASNNGEQGQLRVSWVPPPLKYMDDSMMYEVSYAPADSQTEQVWHSALL